MKIENPEGIIEIVNDGFLSCLRIKEPRVADWPNCEGTVARYYTCFPPNDTRKNELREIEENISKINSVEDFISSGFLSLLKTGEYEFELWKEHRTEYLYNTSIVNSNRTIFKWHNERIGNNRVAKPYSPNTFYPYGRLLLFTEPFESINLERVKHYENLISKGERPKAITIRELNMRQENEDEGQPMVNTAKYVLDGHHKLVAYKNLNILPHYIVINKLPGTKNRNSSCLPQLKKLLYRYQQEHIISWGIDSLYTPTNEFSEYLDSYLSSSTRIEEILIKRIYNISKSYSTRHVQIDEIKRQWFRDRLELFKKRFEVVEIDLIFSFYERTEFKTKHQKVNSWSEIETILNE
jgi:hypothetical protein